MSNSLSATHTNSWGDKDQKTVLVQGFSNLLLSCRQQDTKIEAFVSEKCQSLCLWEMLGRLTFISTSLSDLTDHHFVHFLVYAYIMNPCRCLLYFHLALYSWVIFYGFKLPPDILTSLNIHYLEREYLQYRDPTFLLLVFLLFFFFSTGTLF